MCVQLAGYMIDGIGNSVVKFRDMAFDLDIHYYLSWTLQWMAKDDSKDTLHDTSVPCSTPGSFTKNNYVNFVFSHALDKQ